MAVAIDGEQHRDLVLRARSAAVSLQTIARVVEVIAIAAMALLVAYLIAGVSGWPAFTALVVAVFIGGLLVARVARARSVALEVAAAQLELATEGRGVPSTDPGSEGDRG